MPHLNKRGRIYRPYLILYLQPRELYFIVKSFYISRETWRSGNPTGDLSSEASTMMSYRAEDNPRSSSLRARDIPLP